ncbi:MAG: epimerase [Kineosporiaceae bacterium]
MKVVVAGGTGALGRRLTDALARGGHEVVVLTRRIRPGIAARQVRWDGVTPADWVEELDGASVVNLAGELVDRPPTPASVGLLTQSRVAPTRALVEASRRGGTVRSWVQASTLAIHGDAGETVVDDDSPPADGPPQMAGVARAWEAALDGAVTAEGTTVLRTSVVLDAGTPALDRLLLLTRWGLGGRVGSGRQWVSWIHVADWLRVVEWCLGASEEAGTRPLRGTVVASSPNPVRNAELMSTLRRVTRRPPAPPTPAWGVRWGARLLRTDPALGLTGRRGHPGRLLEADFKFRHPHLEPALRDLLGR